MNVSEVHRIYQILEEEDNVKFMTMIGAKENVTTDNATEQVQAEDVGTNDVVTETSDKVDLSEDLIKTETRTGYVNIDGTEREKTKNDSILRDIVKDRISSYLNKSSLLQQKQDTTLSSEEIPTETKYKNKFDVDDIIVPQSPQEADPLQTPSGNKAKEAFKLLPKVIQDFLSRDWKSQSKCEPQHLLERIRKEKRYPDHKDVHKYELLLTPAPSFLQRISLAGEFLNKKQLEM